jgi:hypothetical protein
MSDESRQGRMKVAHHGSARQKLDTAKQLGPNPMVGKLFIIEESPGRDG